MVLHRRGIAATDSSSAGRVQGDKVGHHHHKISKDNSIAVPNLGNSNVIDSQLFVTQKNCKICKLVSFTYLQVLEMLGFAKTVTETISGEFVCAKGPPDGWCPNLMLVILSFFSSHNLHTAFKGGESKVHVRPCSWLSNTFNGLLGS